jgi:hypothetical protein
VRVKKEVYVLVRYTSMGLTVPNKSLAATISLAIVVIDFRVPLYTYFLVPEATAAASNSVPLLLSSFLVSGRPVAPGLRTLVQNFP